MTSIDLYKFITDKECEFHWIGDNHDEDVILFINFYDIKDWSDILGDNIMDEHGLDCTMKSDCFCFKMLDICEYFGIDLAEVFKMEAESH